MTYYAQGPYRAEIINQGLGQTSTGNPQFWLQIRVLESTDVNPIPVQQYDRTIYWVITENTVEFVVEKLQRLGFNRDSFRLLDPNHRDHQSFVGQEVDAWCKLETYDGKEREKWDLSFSGGAPKIEAIDEAGARQLDAMFGRKLKEKIRGDRPNQDRKLEPASVTTDEDRTNHNNDDIPF